MELLQRIMEENTLLLALSITVISFVMGFLISKYLDSRKLASAKKISRQIIEDARREAEVIKKEKVLEAAAEIQENRSRSEEILSKKKRQLNDQEFKIKRREEDNLREKDRLFKKEKDLNKFEQKIQEQKTQLDEMEKEYRARLESISGMSAADAKKVLQQQIEAEAEKDAQQRIRRIEEEAKAIAKKKANSIITMAIQRYAAEHVAETTVSVVNLPSDDMKGRIIGREGRNIREFEKLTGVDLIVDDTPEAVLISSFDPIRREVARMALERLVADGRIHPARIEELVSKCQKEVEDVIKEEGEKACYELGIHNMANELVKILGRLYFRTSYGQNVLKHSVEMAYIGGMIAAEVGGDVQKTRRACLLHDIGKAVSHEIQGPHAVIGGQICKKYNEAPDIVHAVAAHHYDEEPKTIEAVIVAACDAITAARPGARRENLEIYLKRLEDIEKIAESFDGVEKTYAIQAGREVRVIVSNQNVNDEEAMDLARKIARKIEKEVQYPGEVKVTVIRETRVVEYAR